MIRVAHASASSSAAPHRFFARWIDHSTWSEWSPDTEWARVDGAVRQGATGALKPRGGPRISFVVAEYEADRRYTDESRFPGARLTFRHTVDPDGAGSRVAAEVWLHGPLAAVWARVLGRGFRTSVPDDLRRLVRLVEAI